MRGPLTSGTTAPPDGAVAPGYCVGIVIPVPEPAASRLDGWRREFAADGDAVPAHITLVTTTVTPNWPAMVAHVRRAASSVEPFEIGLDGSGTFRPLSPVVYVRIREGFDACVRLHGLLQAGPLGRDLEFPFHPHVTVAQQGPDDRLDAAARATGTYRARFGVSSIGLYEYGTDGAWVRREELILGQEDNTEDSTETGAEAGANDVER